MTQRCYVCEPLSAATTRTERAPTYAEVLECARRIGRVTYSYGPWQRRACRETACGHDGYCDRLQGLFGDAPEVRTRPRCFAREALA